MTSAPAIAARVLSPGLTLTNNEAEAVLEIAYLAIAADHKLAESELVAFRGVVERLQQMRGSSGPVSDRRLHDLLDRLAKRAEHNAVEDRLRALARNLSAGAREAAYKVAHAIALADLDSSDEEFEFDLQLIDALELTTEQAETFESDVMSAMYEPEEPGAT